MQAWAPAPAPPMRPDLLPAEARPAAPAEARPRRCEASPEFVDVDEEVEDHGLRNHNSNT